MQTFLPYPHFTVSAMCLDYQRLGKQRVEARQMQNWIQATRMLHDCWDDVSADEYRVMARAAAEHTAEKLGRRVNSHFWHPCTVMWRNSIKGLMAYGDTCIREWVRRGYNNTMPLMLNAEITDTPNCDFELPGWVGREDFHASHRSNLLRKDAEFYSRFGWDETPDLEYVWPEEDA